MNISQAAASAAAVGGDFAPAAPATPPASPAPAAPASTPPATPPAAPADKNTPAAGSDPKPAEPQKTAADKASEAIKNVLKKPDAKDGKKGEDISDEEFEKHAKSNRQFWARYDKLRSESKAKYESLEAKIKELEAKPAPTTADTAKLQALEKQLAEESTRAKQLQQKLAEREFEETDDNKKIVDRWSKTYTDAYKFTKSLQVLDAEGNPARQATEADFDKILNTPLQERRALAKAMFGEDVASDIIDHVKELHKIANEQREARANHSKNWEKLSKERAESAQRERETYEKMLEGAKQKLETDYPDHFSPAKYNDDAELKQALEDGYKIVDDAMKNAEAMSADERAAFNAVIRARAAGFPLQYLKNQRLEAKIEQLTKELEELRGKDPGGKAGGDPGGGSAAEPVGGIAQAAAKFGQLA